MSSTCYLKPCIWVYIEAASVSEWLWGKKGISILSDTILNSKVFDNWCFFREQGFLSKWKCSSRSNKRVVKTLHRCNVSFAETFGQKSGRNLLSQLTLIFTFSRTRAGPGGCREQVASGTRPWLNCCFLGDSLCSSLAFSSCAYPSPFRSWKENGVLIFSAWPHNPFIPSSPGPLAGRRKWTCQLGGSNCLRKIKDLLLRLGKQSLFKAVDNLSYKSHLLLWHLWDGFSL